MVWLQIPEHVADEIVKMQDEMMEMTQLQAEFQQDALEFDTRFTQLESDSVRSSGNVGWHETRYNKLPDGEGTPPWALKKGSSNDLLQQCLRIDL